MPQGKPGQRKHPTKCRGCGKRCQITESQKRNHVHYCHQCTSDKRKAFKRPSGPERPPQLMVDEQGRRAQMGLPLVGYRINPNSWIKEKSDAEDRNTD